MEAGVHHRGGQQQTDPRCPVRAHRALSARDPGPHGTWGDWAEGRAGSPRAHEVGSAAEGPSVAVQACATPGGFGLSEGPAGSRLRLGEDHCGPTRRVPPGRRTRVTCG